MFRGDSRETPYRKSAVIWQISAGICFLLVQLAALLAKKTGPMLQWVAEMAQGDLWKTFKFFSLGLVGVLVIVYALAEYRYAKGTYVLRIAALLMGAVLLWRQVFLLMNDARAFALPWQQEGGFVTVLFSSVAYFGVGLLGVLCFALAGVRKGSVQSGSYLKASFSAMHSTRLLVFAALMIAMARALSIVPGIPIAHTKLTFGFLARALCAMVCGPILGLVYGFVEDILGFILQPTGEFFIGYTLSTMLGVLVYAVFLYRRKVTVVNIVLANLVVNLFVNALLGSVWTMMTRGGGYWGWFIPSLLKNLLTVLPKSFMLFFLFRAMLPILRQMGVIDKNVGDRIGWFSAK